MIRTLCIFTLVVVATLGQDEPQQEIKEKESDKETKPNVAFSNIFEPCVAPFVTQNYNPNWEKDEGINENSTIYFPLMSKGDAYRLTQSLYQNPQFEEFTEEHLANSCIRMQRDVTGTMLTMKGYNDKSFVKYLTPTAPKSYYFPSNYPQGHGGRNYISLSDNKSFTVWVLCHDDGLGSFAVTSAQRTLPPETLNIAKEHVKALGFKEENFLEPNSELDCESPLESVPVAKNLTVIVPLPLFPTNFLAGPATYFPFNYRYISVRK